MFKDILSNSTRKIIYRIWAWLNVIILVTISILDNLSSISTPKLDEWLQAIIVGLTLFGSLVGLAAADNTPNEPTDESDNIDE